MKKNMSFLLQRGLIAALIGMTVLLFGCPTNAESDRSPKIKPTEEANPYLKSTT